MITRKLSAGDTIEAICTRCRKVLNHTIVAMVGERVARVECNTCRGTHNYHGEREQKGKTGSVATTRKPEAAPRKSKRDPGEADREEWESLRPTMAVDKALPYAMTGRYPANSLINHAAFGLGIVKLVIKPNKIEVLFQEGKKLLRVNSL